MPPAFLQDPGLGAVLAAIPDARVVGGAVRDALAGRKVADVDLATPLPPHEVAERLERAGIRAVPTGIDHGTVTAVTASGPIEITTLRRDEATDGRHATVAFTRDWKEDAARRDFTINAMSMAPDGTLYDYFGGADDLRAGRVRFVGEAARRIAEDYLRILRFFRFWARYGTGDPDPDAGAAIAAGVSGLSILSPERVWSELKRILAAPDPMRAVALMAELGVLAAVLPGGADPAALAALVASGAPADPLLRLAALAQGGPDDLADRLRLSNDERDRLAALRDTAVPRPDSDDAALRRALADTPADILIGRSWLHGGGGPDWGSLRARLAAMPQPVFPLSGRDVVALGIPPGPAVGEALRAVRAWWLDDGCQADAQACTAELARQLALRQGR
ncbi:MAG TPA: CCA tRNA nucleotidyltransferase [Acidisphaera sp.]|nr:CCA tRNA nucleotidyltransferase [Acidisphaera sp.]